jgi:hypothetical protein
VSAPALPGNVGSYELTETRIFADSMLGTWHSYSRGRDRRIDVMVQPSLTLERHPATAQDITARAVSSFKSVRTGRAGPTEFALVVDRRDSVTLGARTFPGHVVAAIARGQNAERMTVLHVYYLGARYVRIVTMIPGGAGEDEAARVVEQMLPALIASWRL